MFLLAGTLGGTGRTSSVRAPCSQAKPGLSPHYEAQEPGNARSLDVLKATKMSWKRHGRAQVFKRRPPRGMNLSANRVLKKPCFWKSTFEFLRKTRCFFAGTRAFQQPANDLGNKLLPENSSLSALLGIGRGTVQARWRSETAQSFCPLTKWPLEAPPINRFAPETARNKLAAPPSARAISFPTGDGLHPTRHVRAVSLAKISAADSGNEHAEELQPAQNGQRVPCK